MRQQSPWLGTCQLCVGMHALFGRIGTTMTHAGWWFVVLPVSLEEAETLHTVGVKIAEGLSMAQRGTFTMARGMMPCPSGPLPPCIVCVLPAPVWP